MKKTGSADLPLHGGHVPYWLYSRMTELGREIVRAIVYRFGRDEFLRRISDPFWFQAFGSVLGMDWHSSGITTSVMGALKRALNPISKELGIYICGGKGRHSRKTPEEILEISNHFGIDGTSLVLASRLSAKVDNSCVQDGFNIYLHSFIVSSDGKWAVVQQGMNENKRMARRYHWYSGSVRSLVLEPHSGIAGRNMGEIINLSDKRAKEAQEKIVEFTRVGVDRQLREIEGVIRDMAKREEIPSLKMPKRHSIDITDINLKRLGSVLAVAYENQFNFFKDLLLLKGVGARTLQALSLVSEIIYGKPTRFKDPARFAFAYGGKDGHPFPVKTKSYDESIKILRDAVENAKIGRSERLKGMEKLDYLTRRIEKYLNPKADFDRLVEKEKKESDYFGGRMVGKR